MDEIVRKYGGVQYMELFFSLVVWTCFLALTELVALAVAGKLSSLGVFLWNKECGVNYANEQHRKKNRISVGFCSRNAKGIIIPCFGLSFQKGIITGEVKQIYCSLYIRKCVGSAIFPCGLLYFQYVRKGNIYCISCNRFSHISLLLQFLER